MSTFLYFLPKVKSMDEAKPLLQRLSPYAAPVDQFSRVEASGPGGIGGLILTPPQSGDGETPCGYYPEKQTWRECKGFWIGWEKDSPPGPDDLVRSVGVDYGYSSELGDGNQWRIPVARRWPEGTALPRTMGIDAKGELAGEVMERYRELWEMATLVWDKVHAEARGDDEEFAIEFDERKEFDIAVAALAANYQIGMWEATALGLLNENTIANILKYLIDLPAYAKHILASREVEGKKKPSTKVAGG